jgi:RNA polymerase sigma-70 factor (ECF subfamily)
MTNGQESCVTTLLAAASSGDREAANDLFRLLEDELRSIASSHLERVPARSMIQTTMLIDDAFLRLLGREECNWADRAQFIRAAARAMHDIIVDDARHNAALKRGGGLRHVELNELQHFLRETTVDVLVLDEALDRLRARFPDTADVVEMRFFGGLTRDQAAAVLDLSLATVDRQWEFARAWLRKQLDDPASAEPNQGA